MGLLTFHVLKMVLPRGQGQRKQNIAAPLFYSRGMITHFPTGDRIFLRISRPSCADMVSLRGPPLPLRVIQAKGLLLSRRAFTHLPGWDYSPFICRNGAAARARAKKTKLYNPSFYPQEELLTSRGDYSPLACQKGTVAWAGAHRKLRHEDAQPEKE